MDRLSLRIEHSLQKGISPIPEVFGRPPNLPEWVFVPALVVSEPKEMFRKPFFYFRKEPHHTFLLRHEKEHFVGPVPVLTDKAYLRHKVGIPVLVFRFVASNDLQAEGFLVNRELGIVDHSF